MRTLRRWGRVAIVLAFLAGVSTPWAEAGEPHAIKVFKPTKGELRAGAVSRDGKAVAFQGEGGIGVWEVESGKQVVKLDAAPIGEQCLAFSPDGRVLFMGNMDGKVRRLEVATGKELTSLAAESLGTDLPRWVPLAFSPDGSTLAAGDGGRTSGRAVIHLWDLSKEREIRTLDVGSGLVGGFAFSPDGKTLAVNSPASAVSLWSVESGTKRGVTGPGGGLGGIAFTPDGNTLVAPGAGMKSIGLWDVAALGPNGADPARVIEGHVNSVSCLAVSPDGKLLVSACRNATGPKDLGLRIWSLQSGKRLRVFNPDPKGVQWVDFCCDGKTLVTGGTTAVKLWDVEKLLGN